MFTPNRTAALQALHDFLPKAGRDYAMRRNYDLPDHPHVSRLSPYLRHRLMTEAEVLTAVLERYNLSTAEKFVQEVYWRTYWKGWLELRPQIWSDYRREVQMGLNRVQSEEGLRAEFDAACAGRTEIDCFNFWAQELVKTGYLYNHARMWFASIWVFTLRLPWALGADFFLRHLLDGDPASNTLSWRWVAGLQTKGKTYLARASNIAEYTEGRFRPAAGDLADHADALESRPHPPVGPMPVGEMWNPDLRTALLLSEEDLSPGYLFEAGLSPVQTATLNSARDRSPLILAPMVKDFTHRCMADAVRRYADKLGAVTSATGVQEVADWARATGAAQIVTPYAPVGPAQEALDRLEIALKPDKITLIRVLRDYDRAAWPSATHGFFKFREHIPELVGNLKGLRAVS